MLIARVVKSNSHIDYAGRVLNKLEVAEPPQTRDYRFGQFVRISSDAADSVGVIYNSLLINPEYGNYGPRLSTPPDLNSVFSPDFLNEQGVLIGVLLVGWKDAAGTHQGIPLDVLPINAGIETMSDEEVRDFHHTADGRIEVHYYTQLTSHAGSFAFALLAEITRQLERLTTDVEKARLAVLRKTVAWQQTVGTLK